MNFKESEFGSMAKKQAKKQKLSAKQIKEREERARERERIAQQKEQRSLLMKRVFVIAVCVILILALSLPTMGLMFLGGSSS